MKTPLKRWKMRWTLNSSVIHAVLTVDHMPK
jgi:hypothetical protein